MRIFFTISIVFSSLIAYSQTDCRDVTHLMEKLWKHDIGSVSWKRVLDSVQNICPNHAKIWDNRAMAYMLRGQFIEGMYYLNKAAKADPIYYIGNRAWCRMRYLHDYKNAIVDLDSIERIVGTSFVYVISTHMYILKGQSYQELGDYEKALEAYNYAIAEQIKDKGDNWVGTYDYLQRGILRYKMGDHDGAITDLTRQVKEYEALADTYYYRGLAYAAVGRRDEARTDIQHAKELILGGGERRWDGPFVLPDEVFLSDVENALLRLN